MSDLITYRDMEQFLTKELHFQAHIIEGSHTIFRRTGIDTVIVLNPWYKVLPKRQLAYIRQMLVQNGILTEFKFNEKLRHLQTSHSQDTKAKHKIFDTNGQPNPSPTAYQV